jgi:hypothetical protein
MKEPMTRDECITYLKRLGWGPEAAQGIVAHLDTESTRGMIPTDRWGLFCDWASAHERKREYHSTALAFLDYELRNPREAIGRELDKAKTQADAAAAVAPYFGRRSAVRFLTLEEARERGYVDPGNPELRDAPH